jgi:hypothetical protein
VDDFGPAAPYLTDEHRAILRDLGARAPVILCSAELWARDLTAEELGVAAVLPEPFDLDVLQGVLARVGGGQAA